MKRLSTFSLIAGIVFLVIMIIVFIFFSRITPISSIVINVILSAIWVVFLILSQDAPGNKSLRRSAVFTGIAAFVLSAVTDILNNGYVYLLNKGTAMFNVHVFTVLSIFYFIISVIVLAAFILLGLSFAKGSMFRAVSFLFGIAFMLSEFISVAYTLIINVTGSSPGQSVQTAISVMRMLLYYIPAIALFLVFATRKENAIPPRPWDNGRPNPYAGRP